MVTRLKLISILKRPTFGLAFKGLVFGLFLYFYYLNPSITRGVLLVFSAFWFYNQPLFSFFSFLPTLSVLLALSLWVGAQTGTLNFVSLLVLVIVFAIMLGVKNLILTNRSAWHCLVVFVLSYLVLLNFFLLDHSSLFSIKWILALVMLAAIFKNIFNNRALLALLILLMGELMWIVNWLPIGSLSSANLSALQLIFLVDVMYHHRLSWKNTFLFIALTIVILVSSYWRI